MASENKIDRLIAVFRAQLEADLAASGSRAQAAAERRLRQAFARLDFRDVLRVENAALCVADMVEDFGELFAHAA